MALALTEFEAMCGFRPLSDIAHNLRDTPELASLIPPSILQEFYSAATSSESSSKASPEQKTALKNLFAAVMTAPSDQVHSSISSLIARYSTSSSPSVAPSLRNLILKLQTQYPYDVGVLCPLLLNTLNLSPGEAIYLGAGEPHAYISGEAVECMANSDNVIRAGLTPKLRDVGNLVKGLTYEAGEGSRASVVPTPFGGEGKEGAGSAKSLLYDPPIEEFSVVSVALEKGASEMQRAVDGPSLVIVTEGSGSLAWAEEAQVQGMKEVDLGLGDVVFIAKGTPVSFSTRGKEGGLKAYRAFVEA